MWIRRLGVRVPLTARHFLSQKLCHVHKSIRSCVENECCCPHTVHISNVNFASNIYIYIYIHTCIYIYICIRICIYINTYTYVYTYIYTHTHTHTYTQTHTHTYTHKYTYIHIHIIGLSVFQLLAWRVFSLWWQLSRTAQLWSTTVMAARYLTTV